MSQQLKPGEWIDETAEVPPRAWPQPEALRLADELNYHDDPRLYDEADVLMMRAAAELRRLHQSEREGWRYANELEQERKRLHEENSKLRREVAAISANAVDDGRAISKLEAQLGEAVWNYGEVKRVNAQLLEALELAEAGLADIGDADREPGDDLAWCERRAAEPLPVIRAAIAAAKEAA